MMGIIYENFSLLDQDGKQKVMMQNEVNEVHLNFQEAQPPSCLIVPGCTYLAYGNQEGKDLSLRVSKIELPSGPP
jgi:hypothetical protein